MRRLFVRIYNPARSTTEPFSADEVGSPTGWKSVKEFQDSVIRRQRDSGAAMTAKRIPDGLEYQPNEYGFVVRATLEEV